VFSGLAVSVKTTNGWALFGEDFRPSSTDNWNEINDGVRKTRSFSAPMPSDSFRCTINAPNFYEKFGYSCL